MKINIWVIISVIIGITILPSITLCDYKKVQVYTINDSGFYYENFTIFKGPEITSDSRASFYICPGNTSPSKKTGCTWLQKDQSVEYDDIINNNIIKFNGDKMIITQSGFFCLNKKLSKS